MKRMRAMDDRVNPQGVPERSIQQDVQLLGDPSESLGAPRDAPATPTEGVEPPRRGRPTYEGGFRLGRAVEDVGREEEFRLVGVFTSRLSFAAVCVAIATLLSLQVTTFVTGGITDGSDRFIDDEDVGTGNAAVEFNTGQPTMRAFDLFRMKYVDADNENVV